MQCLENEKLIFIHVPKTGGTFVERKLAKLKNKVFGGHSNYIHFKNKIKSIDNYNIFSIVRNPYDRLISAYFYFIKPERCKYDKNEWKELGNPKSISELIN